MFSLGYYLYVFQNPEKCEDFLYRAPEHLRSPERMPDNGTQKGDVYSFAIILYEMHSRKGPFGETELHVWEIIDRIINPGTGPLFRPDLDR